MALRLNDNVFFCVAQGLGVFLDLKKDAYSAIPIASNARLVTRNDVATAFRMHRADLIADGLIIDSGGEDDLPTFDQSVRNIQAWGYEEGNRLFGSTNQCRDVRLRIRDYIDFFASMWIASRQLGRRSLYSVVSSVRDRKRHSTTLREPDARLDAALLAFGKLRPLYPKPYRCLLDALGLLHFLARRRLYVDWVFGVQAQPFGAHCWLERRGMVLNDSIEYARQFSPIMIV